MSLDTEISMSAKEIFTDGYDMSVGEVISLYRDDEIIINPEFQRLFRWNIEQKSAFIESLLLGIPIPPIFVFQNSDGIWELVDGLQRMSTVLEFMGLLKNPDGGLYPPSILSGTRLLPSLEGKTWEGDDTSIGKTQQITIKRARLRVEIIKKESDVTTKFSLFQRLNTGGSHLTPQEVRNSIMLMISRPFFDFVKSLASYAPFLESMNLTDKDMSEQREIELVLRLMAYEFFPYDKKLDLNEYLDAAVFELSKLDLSELSDFKEKFESAFTIINNCFGDSAFKRYSNGRYLGQFLISAFEVVAFGILHNIRDIEKDPDACAFLDRKRADIWNNPIYRGSSGSGIRATQRIPVLIPFAKQIFENED